MMSKDAKKNYVNEMKKNFTENESVMIAQYQGLNVMFWLLRKELRDKGLIKLQKINHKISNRRLQKRIRKYFIGPTAAATSIQFQQ